MSGKNTKKSKGGKSTSVRKNKGVLVFLLLLSAVILISLLIAVADSKKHGDVSSEKGQQKETGSVITRDPVQTEKPTESAQSQETEKATELAQTQETENTTEPTQPQETGLFELGNGVRIVDYISYTGAFMEDRTDEVVTDVLGIRVTNTGDQYIQTMDVTLTAEGTQAQFSLSTLFPGETVIVLEKNRMNYSTAPEFERAETCNIARFNEDPGMCQDKLKVQCLSGVINITNISEEDIPGDIFIYYKNYVGGIYYGGITYRIRLQGGLKAGEICQGTAAHFNPDNSKVVFVTCN